MLIVPVIFVLSIVFSPVYASKSSPILPDSFTSEAVLRKYIKTAPRPSFPVEGVKERQLGVVVVRIRLLDDGTVQWAKVLEAPSECLGLSVRDAVLKWQFEPFWPKPARFYGKLTFYFVEENGKAIVLDPSEAAYVGHQRRGSMH